MKILNFGSLNIDHVYQVKSFVRPGETISALSYSRNSGGKGLNQSIALARAGASVYHAGRIGNDGLFLHDILFKAGADCSLLKVTDSDATGHAMIQVSDKGENCIVLYGGANRNIDEKQVQDTLYKMESGDFLLLQNEISSMKEIISEAHAIGMRIFLNPAPMNDDVLTWPLNLVDTFIVNEIEAGELAGISGDEEPEKILSALRRKFSSTSILMTLGSVGSMYAGKENGKPIFVPACKVEKVVDTTAAGDTFIGYFLAETALGKDPENAMKTATKASALCVARPGAANSIPYRKELV